MHHILRNFLWKIFLLFSTNWSNFIDWLPLLFEILGNMCVVILCFPVYDVINIETNFPRWGKMSGQKFNYLKNEKRFKGEIRNIFIFKGFQLAKTVSNLGVGLRTNWRKLKYLIKVVRNFETLRVCHSFIPKNLCGYKLLPWHANRLLRNV